MLKAFLGWWREKMTEATLGGVNDALNRLEHGPEGERLKALLAAPAVAGADPASRLPAPEANGAEAATTAAARKRK